MMHNVFNSWTRDSGAGNQAHFENVATLATVCMCGRHVIQICNILKCVFFRESLCNYIHAAENEQLDCTFTVAQLTRSNYLQR